MRRLALALTLTVVLAGCSAAPAPTQPPSRTPSAAPSAPPSAASQLPKSGQFVSQGATTGGTVELAAISDKEFTLTLTGFSTGPGDDLRLHLSTGELVQGADGFYYVDDGNVLEVEGKVEPDAPTQTFTFPLDYLDFGDFRSLTIYDYANLTALGSAALD
ncbi:hypothetical protein BH09ACT5_BH09ACT5_10870 [soil metagenome]